MQLQIITPEKKETHTISWLELNTPVGNMIIKPGHIPTILTLSPDQPFIYCLPSGAQKKQIVTKGFAHVTRANVTLLLTSTV